ncbi:MAG: hypothetical protein KDJ45_09890 [Hyphomicrobiaceae bacterium]|nr:hypothetical protein [Hyphomicrobiaceae bacterium]MCC0011243.1 hypothetical protein [Hyphomicrobiaceae bacterium]
MQINVIQTSDADPFKFDVRVHGDGGQTQHHVTMGRNKWRELSGEKHAPARCVEAAFRFLLDREGKESILSTFDITIISRYFPEFENELPKYLERG